MQEEVLSAANWKETEKTDENKDRVLRSGWQKERKC